MLAKKFRLPMFCTPMKGSRVHGEHIDLVINPNLLTHSRFAVLISKKVSPKAVVRNQIKRQLLHSSAKLLYTPPPRDILIIAKSNARNTDYSTLDRELTQLYSKYI